MKYFFKQKITPFILAFFTILFSFSFNISSRADFEEQEDITKETQKQTTKPKLEILSAEYGLLDDKVRSGELVALMHVDEKKFLTASKKDDWFRSEKEDWQPGNILRILKVDGKQGEIIKKGDEVNFKVVGKDKETYLGCNKKFWHKRASGLKARKMHGANQITKKDDASIGFTIHGNVKHKGKIQLKSTWEKEKGKILERYTGDSRPILWTTDQNHKNRWWFIYRLAAPKARYDYDSKIYRSEFVKKPNKKNEQISDILSTFIGDSKINWKGNYKDWEKYFGNPVYSKPEKSCLFKQLKIEYRIGRNKNSKTFEQSDGGIQLPSKEELTKSERELTSRLQTKNDLQALGFESAPSYLKQLSICGKQIVGFNNHGTILKWNKQEENWEEIVTEEQIKKIQVTSKGKIYALTKDNKIRWWSGKKRVSLKVSEASISRKKKKKKTETVDVTRKVANFLKGNNTIDLATAIKLFGEKTLSLTIIFSINKKEKEIVLIGNKVFNSEQIILNHEWPTISNAPYADISLTSKDNFWIVSVSGKVFKLINKKKWVTVGKKTRLSKISTALDGTTYGLTKEGTIFRWVGGNNYTDDDGWVKIQGPKLKDIFVGSEKYVWGIGENEKTYKLEDEDWVEELAGIPVSQVATNAAGEVWVLVAEMPANAAGNSIFYKSRNVWTFGSKISFLGYYKNYLSVQQDKPVNASTQWADKPETFVVINPSNTNDTGPIDYQKKVVLKTYLGNYLGIKGKQIVDSSAAYRWKFVTKEEQTGEIEKGTDVPVALQASDGKYLGTKRSGQVYLIKNPTRTSYWQIEAGVN